MVILIIMVTEGKNMYLELRVIIGIIALILILGIATYLLFIRPKQKINKKEKSPKIDVKWILALLGENNIKAIEQVQSRVRITVNNLELVNLEGLKEQTNGVFLKGNLVVVTFKNNTEEIVESLKGAIK